MGVQTDKSPKQNNIKDWTDKIVLKWTTLKILGAARIMSITALLPFLGFIFVSNKEVSLFFSSLNEFFHLGNVSHNGNAPTNLLFLYFGGVVLGVGKIMFNVSCPDEISLYNSREDFITTREELRTRREYIFLLYKIAEQDDEYREEAIRIKDTLFATESGPSYNEGFRTCLDLRYEFLNKSKHLLRFFTSMLFLVGLSLISVPSIKTLCTVVVLLKSGN